MLKKKTRIDEYQIMHYFVQILQALSFPGARRSWSLLRAQALQYIHGERILHRDLKTSNLFLMKSKSVGVQGNIQA